MKKFIIGAFAVLALVIAGTLFLEHEADRQAKIEQQKIEQSERKASSIQASKESSEAKDFVMSVYSSGQKQSAADQSSINAEQSSIEASISAADAAEQARQDAYNAQQDAESASIKAESDKLNDSLQADIDAARNQGTPTTAQPDDTKKE